MRELCIRANYGYSGRYVERITLAKDAGFDSVFISMRRAGKRLATFDNICQAIDLAKENGVKLEFLHMPNLKEINSIWQVGDMGDIYTDYLIGMIFHSRLLGVKKFCLHTCYKREVDAPSELALRRFQRIANACERFGCVLGIENTESRLHDEFVLDNLDSKAVGFCYDSGHETALYHAKCGSLLDKYGDKLVLVHLHDNMGELDDHLLPFDGVLDWDKITTKLAKCPDVNVVLEVKKPGDPDSLDEAKQYLATALDRAKELRSMIEAKK